MLLSFDISTFDVIRHHGNDRVFGCGCIARDELYVRRGVGRGVAGHRSQVELLGTQPEVWPSSRLVDTLLARVFIMGGQRREFTPEYKDEAVRLVINTGRAVASVARELGINEATLGRWVNAFRAPRQRSSPG